MVGFYMVVRWLLGTLFMLVLGACGEGAPRVNISETQQRIDVLRTSAFVQAEAQLGLKFNVLERYDIVGEQKTWVYHNVVSNGEDTTYLTVNVLGDNRFSWVAARVNTKDGTLETFKLAPLVDVAPQSLGTSPQMRLSKEVQNLTELTVPESLKRRDFTPQGFESVKKPLSSQSVCAPPANACEPPDRPKCHYCAETVTVPGRYVESGLFETVVTWTASGVAGVGCGGIGAGPSANPYVVGAAAGVCGGTVAYVLRQIMNWVPGYRYCARWSWYQGVCPTTWLPSSRELLALTNRNYVIA